MSTSSDRRIARGGQRPAAAGAQALGLVALLAIGVAGIARAQNTPAADVQRLAALSVEVDHVRAEANLGDAHAAPLLVDRLLDRYESAGASEDLFEALQWIESGLESAPDRMAELASRLVERHCSHRLLRWHWLCRLEE